MGWSVSAFHNRTAWHRSHYACPDLLRSIALAPSWSVLLALSSPLATVLAINASARSLHKHSHAAQVGLGRASDMSERRTRRAEQEVDDLLGDDLARKQVGDTGWVGGERLGGHSADALRGGHQQRGREVCLAQRHHRLAGHR